MAETGRRPRPGAPRIWSSSSWPPCVRLRGERPAYLRPDQDQPALQLNLNDLSPTSGEQIYASGSTRPEICAAFPLARDRVTESGTLTGATPIRSDIAPLLGQFRCIDVSLATRAETEAAIRQAVEGGQALPRHTGESVLRGQIPAAPGGSAPSGADSQCELDPAALQGGGQGSAQGGQ